MAAIAIDLCERGLVPDALMRFGMRRLMANRLREESLDGSEAQFARYRERVRALRESAVAIETARANEQHYEVPAAFFARVLGPHLKYSCCLFDEPGLTLGEAEQRMLAATCDRAQLAEGQDILELGCGWGSLTLWMAARYPGARILAVSNSASQREFITGLARERGLGNIRVITADANDFDTSERFDRVVSVEMFEHMRNYAMLLERISRWLKDDGRLFVHIFCHRSLMYPFTTERDDDWMGRYFFTGGLMPAENTLLNFQEHVTLEEQWRVSGVHYERTANAWLRNMDENAGAVLSVLRDAYGPEAQRWFHRWRMFFMACAELFGFESGTQWWVAHYRFQKSGVRR
jgi:cyclopropane-fatty-acyl-phospholipid synthase